MVRYAVMVVVLAGCFPYAIPPLKGELGASTHTRRPTAIRVAGGAHLASATLRRDQPFDVGAGLFYESAEGGFETKGGYADAAWFIDRGRRTAAPPASTSRPAGAVARQLGRVRRHGGRHAAHADDRGRPRRHSWLPLAHIEIDPLRKSVLRKWTLMHTGRPPFAI